MTDDDVMQVECPNCGHRSRTKRTNVGKQVRCRNCGEPFAVIDAKLPIIEELVVALEARSVASRGNEQAGARTRSRRAVFRDSWFDFIKLRLGITADTEPDLYGRSASNPQTGVPATGRFGSLDACS